MADKQFPSDQPLGSPEHKPKVPSTSADVSKLATALGGAAVGNMIFPGLGGALFGAVVATFIASKATKDAADGD